MPLAADTQTLARPRRLLLVLLFAWLNLLVQPCVAEAPALPTGMEHCEHDAGDRMMACTVIEAGGCEMDVDLNADGPRANGEFRPGWLLAVLPVPAVLHAAEFTDLPIDPGARAGPSLTIRFCNLRN